MVRQRENGIRFEGEWGTFRGLPEGFAAGFTRGTLATSGLAPEAAAHALGAALGAPESWTVAVRQRHGCVVLPFEAPPRKRRHTLLGDGDGLITHERNVLLTVASADCVPIVFADPVAGWIAAIHAGWRGTALRIVDAALDALEERGVEPGALHAALGPSLSRDRYEVGPDVVEALREAYRNSPPPAGAVVPGRGDRSFLDVAAFNLAALVARGVAPNRIVTAGLCTASTPDLPSYRRDGPATGRILTGIVRL